MPTDRRTDEWTWSNHQFLFAFAKAPWKCVIRRYNHWCMCDRASYMKMTRGTNLMQQLWFIITNNFTCFGHLCVHLQECRLCTVYQPLTPSYLLQCRTPHTAAHNLHSWRWTYRYPKHVELFMIINHNCCIKLVPLVILVIWISELKCFVCYRA